MATAFTPVAGRSYLQKAGDDEWRDITPIGSPLPQYYSNLTSALKGQFPAEVAADWDKLVAQKTAEQGWAGGLPGSQFTGYAGLYNYFQPLMQRMGAAEQQMAARYPYAMQAAMQDRARWMEYAENARRAQEAQNARLSAAWTQRGGGTPPIVQTGGGFPRVTQPSSRAMLSNIASRYGGGSAEPLIFQEGPMAPGQGFSAPMGAGPDEVGQPIYMSGQYEGIPSYEDLFGDLTIPANRQFGVGEQSPASYEDWWNTRSQDWMIGLGE